MIVSYRPSWRGIIRQVAGPVAASVAFSLGVVVLYVRGYRQGIFTVPSVSLSMFGAVLSIFLGFRTSSAYSRWWEARTLWGALVNQSRSWARMVTSYPRASARDAGSVEQFGQEMVRWQIAYVHTLRQHLRQEPFAEETKLLLAQISGQD